jgi:putative restriction endonuclease
MTVLPAIVMLLEKAAIDNGFDLARAAQGPWRAFASTHAPMTVWLSADPAGRPLVALSRADVANELGFDSAAISLPDDAQAALLLPDIASVHALLRRAFQLANALPDNLLRRYQTQTAAMPKTTEAERLVVQRVGQDLFRDGLLDYWDGRCAVTGLAVPELLRASHIKPWAASTDEERLDVFNGLLLAPQLDAAFDRGFITVDDSGSVLLSPALSPDDRRHLALNDTLRISRLADRHRQYLVYHREVVFRR